MAASKSKAQKELEAQKARAAALRHLESQGESLKSGAALTEDVDKIKAKKDNTLEILRRQTITSQLKDGKEHELKARAAFLQQRTAGQAQAVGGNEQSTVINVNGCAPLAVNTSKETLPTGWQVVEDKTNGKKYYWNTVTNETSWDKPESTQVAATEDELCLPPGWEVVIDKTSLKEYFWNKSTNETRWERPTSASTMGHKEDNSDLLPPGWAQTVHPATKQAFYVNEVTGEKSFKRPPHITESSSGSSNVGTAASSKKRSIGDVNQAENSAAPGRKVS